MYDELMSRLREVEEMLKVAQFKEATNLIDQSAEAIEKLSKEVDNWKATAQEERDAYWHWFHQYQEDVPRWIPVTERLPQAERKSYWVCTDTGYQCECRWTNNKFGIRESDEWGWNIFDIPQYQKVVAWIPLPCPYRAAEGEEGVITTKDRIGYIRRQENTDGTTTFKLIEAKIKSVRIGKKGISVYSDRFRALDAEELEWNTEIMSGNSQLVLVEEPSLPLCKELGIDYYIKDSLRKEMEK